LSFGVGACVLIPGGETMITQSNTETTTGPESWVGIDDKNLNTQRGGGGFLTLMLFPLIAFAALAFAAAELAK
jgi:hypothetical protein